MIKGMTTSIDPHTDELSAIYVYLSDLEGKDADVRETKELIKGRVIADYNRDGTLLGIEVLS